MKLYVLCVLILCFGIQAFASEITYISPVPGSKLNPELPFIIFRCGGTWAGADQNSPDLFKITGSLSGKHSFSVVLSDDRLALLLKPDLPFRPGESVDVSVQKGLALSSGDKTGPLEFSFSVRQKAAALLDTFNRILLPIKAAKALPRIQDDTLPADFPPVSMTPVDSAADGYILFANYAATYAQYGPYLVITDKFGNIYKSKRTDNFVFDFKLEPNGWLSYIKDNVGQAGSTGYICDADLNVTDSIKAANGYAMDPHEFMVLPNGHYLMIADDPEIVDMSSVVPDGIQGATVIGCVIQEFDSRKNLVFQWRTWDHYNLTDSYEDLTQSVIDAFHMNSLCLDYDGNLIISVRHLSEVTKIDHNSGAIIWRMGGKNNQFAFSGENEANAPTYFSYQHDVRRLANGNLTMFDNGNGHWPQYSRVWNTVWTKPVIRHLSFGNTGTTPIYTLTEWAMFRGWQTATPSSAGGLLLRISSRS